VPAAVAVLLAVGLRGSLAVLMMVVAVAAKVVGAQTLAGVVLLLAVATGPLLATALIT
jgi:hypothetical protein